MLRYKAGYKYVDGGVHAQVLDFPVAYIYLRRRSGRGPVPAGDRARGRGQGGGGILARPYRCPTREVFDPEMDIEEPNPDSTCGRVRGFGRAPTGAVP